MKIFSPDGSTLSAFGHSYGATVFGPGRDTGMPKVIASSSRVGQHVLFFVRDFDRKQDLEEIRPNLFVLADPTNLPWVDATIVEEIDDDHLRLRLGNAEVIASRGTGQLGTWAFVPPLG